MNPALAGRQFLTPISFLPAPTIALRASGVSRVTLSCNGWWYLAAIIFTQICIQRNRFQMRQISEYSDGSGYIRNTGLIWFFKNVIEKEMPFLKSKAFSSFFQIFTPVCLITKNPIFWFPDSSLYFGGPVSSFKFKTEQPRRIFRTE